MSDLWILFILVSAVLMLAWLTADVVFRRRTEYQDRIWRTALILVAGIPLAWAARSNMPNISLPVPVAFSSSGQSVASPSHDNQTLPDESLHYAGDQTTTRNDKPAERPFVDHSANSAQALANLQLEPSPDSAEKAKSNAAISKTAIPAAEVSVSKWNLSVVFLVVAVVWITGTLLSLTTLLQGALKLRTLVRDSKAVNETWQRRLNSAAELLGLRRRVRMRMSDQISSPLVAGLRNPVLLWPSADDAGFDDESCEEILIHELAHLRRGDLWTNLVLQFTTALWWPHPLIYLLRNRICWLREILCDGAVSQHCDRSHYAETLLHVATRPERTVVNNGQLAIEPRPGTLEARVSSVLDGKTIRWAASAVSVGVAWMCSAILFAAIAALHFEPAEAVQPEPVPQNEEAEQAPASQPVSGRVLSPEGKAITAATVYLLKNPNGSFTLPTKPLTTMVNDEGEFTFDKVEPGGYRIWAETDSQTSLRKKLGGQRFKVKAEKPGPIVLRLHDGCNYLVTVRSATTGKPVANAEIMFGWTDIVRSYHTDKDGVAEIKGLGPATWYFVVRARRHATFFKKIPEQALGTTTSLTFNLEDGGKVFGVVKTPDGKPIANARLGASIVGPAMTPSLSKTQTDAAGMYELTNMPLDQPFDLSCSKEDYRGNRTQLVVPKDKRTLRHDTVLNPRKYGGDALFTVVNADGEPIPNVELINRGNSSGDKRKGTTNEAGECRLQKLWNSHRGFLVVARAEGYIPKRAQVKPDGVSVIQQTIVMERGKTFLGRLLTPDKKPAGGVRIYYNQGESGRLEGGRVNTDPSGLFKITGLPDQSTLTVYSPKGFAPIRDMSIPFDQSDRLDIVMEAEGVLVVRAVDSATGTPLTEYNVRVSFSRDRRQGDPSGGWMASSLSNPGKNVMGTTKQFRLGSLKPGQPFQVTVSAEGYKRRVFPRVVVTTEVEGKPLIVKLSPADPSSLVRVAGRLLDKDGEPVKGALLRLVVGTVKPMEATWKFYRWDTLNTGGVARHSQCRQFLSATTDSSGRFAFEKVEETPWLELFHTGGGVAPKRHLDLRANIKNIKDLSELKLNAEPSGRVEVKLDRKSWPDVESVELSMHDLLDQNSRISTSAFDRKSKSLPTDGNDRPVEFSDLPAGEYSATLYGKYVENPVNGSFRRSSFRRKTIQVEHGKTTQVSFD